MKDFIFDLQRFEDISNTNNNTVISGSNDDDLIENEGNNVTISGGAGNDYIYNGDGKEVSIDGGTGDDTIYNDGYYDDDGNFHDAENTTINGGDGDDEIYNYSNNVTILGGDGDDTIENSGSGVTLNGGDGYDEIYNWGENVTINTSKGNDTILVDVIDSVYGGYTRAFNVEGFGAGDVIVLSKYEKNEGEYEGGSVPLIVTSLSMSNNSLLAVVSDNGESVTVTIGGISDATIENGNIVYKTAGGWTFDGTTATYGDNEVVLGGVKGTLAEPTDDSVVALTADNFSGDVTVTGNAGGYKFSLASGTYNHSFTGTSNADTITNSGANITINAGEGTDSITNSGANVSIDAGADNDTVDNSGNNVTIIAGEGNDSIVNSGSEVTIIASGGNDTIDGFNATSKLQLGDGTETYSTSLSGNNLVINYGTNSVTIKDVSEDEAKAYISDNILGVPFNNTYEILFNRKKDVSKSTAVTLESAFQGIFDTREEYLKLKTIEVEKGFSNSIEIIGNSNSNSIKSGAGNDTLIGGKGDDSLKGGDGIDLFVYDGKGNDIITDFSVTEEKVSLESSVDFSDLRVKYKTKKVVIHYGDNSLTLNGIPKESDEPDVSVESGGANYLIHKGNIYDEGMTSVTLTSDSFITDDQNSGVSEIDGSKLTESLKIDARAATSSVTITGGAKKNTLYGGEGDDELTGGEGKDELYGGEGNDELNGGDGKDKLWGGEGDDILTGGADKDTFIYTIGEGNDTITDFGDGKDLITILDAKDKEFKINPKKNKTTCSAEAVGGDVVLTFFDDSGTALDGSLTIQNYAKSSIKINDKSVSVK